MKKYYFALIDWNAKSPKKMLDRASKVSEKMKDNKNFPEPKVPMTDFDKGFADLQSAYNNRRNGKIAKLELQNAGTRMDIMLRSQAIYVTETSEGDNIIIETSGYEASKEAPTRSVVPDMPTNVRMESKNGNVTLIAKKPQGALSLCWVFYYGQATGTVTVENNRLNVPAGMGVVIISAGKFRELITGLQPGTKVTAQVMAQNPAGCSALSDAVSIYVNR